MYLVQRAHINMNRQRAHSDEYAAVGHQCKVTQMILFHLREAHLSRKAAAQDNLEAAAKSVIITMHVADSRNATGRCGKCVHVNISLLCICSGIALRNKDNHFHPDDFHDIHAKSLCPITIKYSFGAECIFSHTRCISVYMRTEDLKRTRQWQSGGEGESKAASPENQTQNLANFFCEVCSIHEYIMRSMRINLCKYTREIRGGPG
jgi:hypothetical protein